MELEGRLQKLENRVSALEGQLRQLGEEPVGIDISNGDEKISGSPPNDYDYEDPFVAEEGEAPVYSPLGGEQLVVEGKRKRKQIRRDMSDGLGEADDKETDPDFVFEGEEAQAQQADKKQKANGTATTEPCAICLKIPKKDEEVFVCPNCRKTIHLECFAQWVQYKHKDNIGLVIIKCVLCNINIKEINDNPGHSIFFYLNKKEEAVASSSSSSSGVCVCGLPKSEGDHSGCKITSNIF
jgi:hypothetical protein